MARILFLFLLACSLQIIRGLPQHDLITTETVREGYNSATSTDSSSSFQLSSPTLVTNAENDNQLVPEDQETPTTTEGMRLSSRSMQNSFSDLFAWNRPMIATRALNQNELPRLQEIAGVTPRKEFFFGMNPRHMQATSMVQEFFMEQQPTQDIIEIAGALRDRDEINPHAWLRAIVSTKIHRPDMQGLRMPPIVEVIPSLFLQSHVLADLEAMRRVPAQDRGCVLVDGMHGWDNGLENRLWYFREDVMVNSHHWYWHLSYPLDGSRGQQDRQGELFYFMHQQMLARYHSERLSASGMQPVTSFNMRLGTVIPTPYNPHMRDGNSGKMWSARPEGVTISDIRSDILPSGLRIIQLSNRDRDLQNINAAISRGFLVNRNSRRVRLNTDSGFSALVDTVEANNFSVNPLLYGSGRGIHNDGHLILGLTLDPRNQRGTPPTVMVDSATAMRDPIFYAYHQSINDIFNRVKNSLTPYQLRGGNWPLTLPGITLRSISVQSTGRPPNQLQTFWRIRRHDLSRGMDFNRSSDQGPLWTCIKHLDHQDFQYELNIERSESPTPNENVTVRIFMGPHFNQNGRRYTLAEQRHFMFILDTFTTSLQSGMNTIRRRSTETPLTIDFDQSSRELGQDAANSQPFCGCGWPHHLLIPKGNRQGLRMDLFAIITDANQDRVRPAGGSQPQEGSCKSAYVFCGLMGDRYPDRRPMGYPFDQRLRLNESAINGRRQTLQDLARQVPNSAHAWVRIFASNELRNFGEGNLERRTNAARISPSFPNNETVNAS